ncbi:MAG: hypothetical protein H7Y42_10785 [Chitinophagaceae bacterium]|nr:hypothetical protein [Chitinophagaceae bacterium]
MKGIFIIVICGCIFFAALEDSSAAEKIDGTQAAARKAVLNGLKDPYSAKFGRFTQVNKDHACYTVNARNSYGGYTGNQEAFLFKSGNKWLVLDIKEKSHEGCIETWKRIQAKDIAESAAQEPRGGRWSAKNLVRADFSFRLREEAASRHHRPDKCI